MEDRLVLVSEKKLRDLLSGHGDWQTERDLLISVLHAACELLDEDTPYTRWSLSQAVADYVQLKELN